MPVLTSEAIRALTPEEFAEIWTKVNTRKLPWPGHQFIHNNEWPDLQKRVVAFSEAME